MSNEAGELKKRYDDIARSLDYNTTACDYQLRELEIDTAAGCMRDGFVTLDVGCDLGYAVTQYASRFNIEAHGIDYSENMIEGAKRLLAEYNPPLMGTVTFHHASVLELPFGPNSFDVVSSSRCLMALLEWELQKKALTEIHRVLKPGGVLVLMEGTYDGLQRLNDVRQKFGFETIPANGKDRLFTRKFHEDELLKFCQPLYTLENLPSSNGASSGGAE